MDNRMDENATQQEEEQIENYYDKQPKFGNKGPSKLRQHFNRGITTFLVVAACIACYFAFLRFTNIFSVFGEIFRVLKPVIYGFVIAYLLNPIVTFVERYLGPLAEKHIEKPGLAKRVSRSVGIAVSLVVAVAIVTALCNMLIPELYKSIRDLVITLPEQLNGLVAKMNNISIDNSTTGMILKNVVEEGTTMFQTWLRTDLLKQTNVIMSNLTVGVISVISEVMNVLIGVIISVYILFSKELFAGQTKKFVYAIMKPNHANMTIHITRKSNEIFGGFIIGKVIDSTIIGILCFLSLTVLNMPYTLLVSVIVGVTNVVPFFGPYIGAIPSAILIMLSDPMKGVYFIIFILILQQLDGNIIGPKILGDSTGLSAFWVVFSILLGGGLFGFAGMIMGVPTFAVIYYIVQMVLDHRLERKHLPTEASSYDQMSYVDEQGAFVYSEETKEQIEKDVKGN